MNYKSSTIIRDLSSPGEVLPGTFLRQQNFIKLILQKKPTAMKNYNKLNTKYSSENFRVLSESHG